MRIESDGHSRGNPRLFELIEHAPKTGKSPTVWAWPELIDYLKVAGQPVAGPWPPHQQPRPDPEEDSLPVAVPDPESWREARPVSAPAGDPAPAPGDQAPAPGDPAPAPGDQAPAPGDQAPAPGDQAPAAAGDPAPAPAGDPVPELGPEP